MPLSVNEVRNELSASQNSYYYDYQIRRWIEHKNEVKEEVIRTIQNQLINEHRVMNILVDPNRLRTTLFELNRGVLNLISIPERNQVVVYVNTRNKGTVFVEEEASDCLLLFMYYFQHKVHSLGGERLEAVMLVDMTDASTPSIKEIKGQIAMFSGIMGRSFPKSFTKAILCCTWNSIIRGAVMALSRGVGLDVSAARPEEIVSSFSSKYTPTLLGGQLDLIANGPIGTLVYDCLMSGEHKIFPKQRITSYSNKHKIEQRTIPKTELPKLISNHPSSWASVLGQTLNLKEDQDYKIVSTDRTDIQFSTIVILGLVWLPFIICLFVGPLLLTIILGVSAIGTLWHTINSKYNTSEGLLILKCMLRHNLEECNSILQRMKSYIDVESRPCSKTACLAITAALSHDEKIRLRRCIQLVVEAAKPYRGTIPSDKESKQFIDILAWLRRLSQIESECICGCEGNKGNLDYLENHLSSEDQRKRVLWQLTMNKNTNLNHLNHNNEGSTRSLHQSKSYNKMNFASTLPMSPNTNALIPFNQVIQGKPIRITIGNGLYLFPNLSNHLLVQTTQTNDRSTYFYLERRQNNFVAILCYYHTYCIMFVVPFMGKMALTIWDPKRRLSPQPNDWSTFMIIPHPSDKLAFMICERDSAGLHDGRFLRHNPESDIFTFTTKFNKATMFYCEQLY
eukprot:NODE_775_length_2368_cov_24.444989_g661_i0.p1 GENE.NODE_775_length_2368_cov_24.444989_g661_i0~~NODE_775_length_2368_cov_24.444989_g661_i0.p1  ORF type:complete len:680 (-),score=103.62 NODE_775_length_2368_cov_24.444989_g661_i0:264-2303(-)